MLRVHGGLQRNCDGVSRRQFVEMGAAVLGIGLADLLRLEAAAATTGTASKKSLIVFFDRQF